MTRAEPTATVGDAESAQSLNLYDRIDGYIPRCRDYWVLVDTLVPSYVRGLPLPRTYPVMRYISHEAASRVARLSLPERQGCNESANSTYNPNRPAIGHDDVVRKGTWHDLTCNPGLGFPRGGAWGRRPRRRLACYSLKNGASRRLGWHSTRQQRATLGPGGLLGSPPGVAVTLAVQPRTSGRHEGLSTRIVRMAKPILSRDARREEHLNRHE